MKRILGVATIGGGAMISTAIAGIFWFVMANELGAEDYGEITYFISMALIISTVSLFGGSTSITVLTAKKIEIQSSIYLLGIIFSVIASIIAFFIFEEIGLSILIFGFVGFTLVINEALGNRLYRKYSLILIIQKILMVVLSIILYYSIGPHGIILGVGMSHVPFLFFIYTKIKTQKINFSILKNHFGFIAHNFGLDMSGVLNTQIDKIIVGPLLGFALLGNYALGLQIIVVLGILPGIVFRYTLPNDAAGIENKLLKKLTILVTVIISLGIIVLSPHVLPSFFPQYSEVVTLVQILSLALIPSAITLTYDSKFLGKEKSNYVFTSRLIQLGIFITGIVILGINFGIHGVAAAYVISIIGQTIVLIILDKKLIRKNQ
jgi:O-antigen/teichoic acid export membrane protein